MKISYDKDRDLAYVAMFHGRQKSAFTTIGNVTLPEPWQKVDDVVTFTIDWDKDGRLIGFEVAPASKLLPPEALKP